MPKMVTLFDGAADVRAAYGGRGSGKTRTFAIMCAVKGMQYGMSGISGIILCARQFVNSLADSSFEEVSGAIESVPELKAYWDIGASYIKSIDGRVSFAFAGLDRNIASIKSKGRLLLAWVDEAEPVTDVAWSTLIPTLRSEGADWNSELWVSWNPARRNAAVEKRFRNSGDPNVKSVEVNWHDNPMFPAKLDRDRLSDLALRPDQYAHIWTGDYISTVEGAYFAKDLAISKEQGRIGTLSPDPLMTKRAYWDIGGTGAKADATAIWITQFVGREIRVLDHYEAQGQPLATHLQWLRDNGHASALCVLPHDGVKADAVYKTTYQGAIREGGFDVIVVPNQGAGAAKMRIEAVRRLMPQIWFDGAKCQGGIDALGWYHEKIDEKRSIGLGPDHDWSSHSADAFGLMAVHYELPKSTKTKTIPNSKWVV